MKLRGPQAAIERAAVHAAARPARPGRADGQRHDHRRGRRTGRDGRRRDVGGTDHPRHDHVAHGTRVRRSSARLRPGSTRASRCRTPRAASTGTSSSGWSSTTRPAPPRSRRRCRTRSPRAPSASCRPARSSSWPPRPRSRQGVPVTGGFFDGPEWGTQPYTNMFAADAGQRGPQVPGQHRHRDIHEAARGHRPVLVRLRHLALVVAVGRRHGRLLRARRGQGRVSSTPRSRSARWP